MSGTANAMNELLAPLCTPPQPRELPSLPSPPRQPAFSPAVAAQYELSTHIVPAAYPRGYPAVDLPTLSVDGASPEERKKGIARATDELLQLRLKYAQGDLESEPKDSRLLWLCANRYKRKAVGRGLTLVLCHANGLTKESWEPVLDSIISQSSASGPVIEEVWCLEAVQHGDSALLNEGRLSALFDWKDHGRDIVHFLSHYLPDSPSTSLPVHLQRLPDKIAKSRAAHGFEQRTVVGSGHSFGGISVLFAALSRPRLFDSIIGIECVVYPIGDLALSNPGLARVVVPTLSRRALWPSLTVARTDLAKFPLLRTFVASQVAVYLDTALYVRPDGRAALKQDPRAEAVVFEQAAAGVASEHAPKLDKQVAILLVRGARTSIFSGSSEVGAEFIRSVRDARDGRNTEDVIIPGGHLLVQENPEGVATEMLKFLKARHGSQTARL